MVKWKDGWTDIRHIYLLLLTPSVCVCVCYCCLCAFIQVDPSGKYEDLVTIRCFKPHFHLAGGVNLPKIIDCVGSDGQSRRQLVKVRLLED